MHKTTERFRKCLNKLPALIKDLAEKQFNLLKTNPEHPSLHFKKIGKFWFMRISLFYRALAIKDGNDFIWVWIGTHDEYKRIIKNNN